MAKRAYDLFFSAIGLVLLSPLLGVLGILVVLGDGGPALYWQLRVGLRGRQFRICKFRTMVLNAERLGAQVTQDGDPRITRVGRFLRKTKLDELPQLWNVLRGDMSLVGPRPEVPRYVERYTPAQREILNLKPGITDLASLRFRNEEDLLRGAADLEATYLNLCVPRKIELNLEYAAHANVWRDTGIILQTLFPFLGPTPERQLPGSSGSRSQPHPTR